MTTISIFSDPQCTTLIDTITDRVFSADVTVGEGGDEVGRFRFFATERETALWLNRTAALYVSVVEHGMRIYLGRIDVAESTPAGVELTAFGPWTWLGDMSYTGMFWENRYQAWKTWTNGETEPTALINVAEERYGINTDNQLYITAKKGEVFGNSGGNLKMGAVAYYRPSRGTTTFGEIQFTANAALATNWIVELRSYGLDANNVPTFERIVWSQAVSGSSGLQTHALNDDDQGLVFCLRKNAADATFAGDTDSVNVQILGIRIACAEGGSGAPILEYSDIAFNILSAYNSLNPNVLPVTRARLEDNVSIGNDISFIEAADVDVRQWLPPTLRRDTTDDWRIGVDRERRLFRIVRGRRRHTPIYPNNGTTWYGRGDISISNTRQSVKNQVRLAYADETTARRTIRTDWSTDQISVQMFGVRRQETIKGTIGNATILSELVRQQRSRNQTAEFRVDNIETEAGALVPGHVLDHGDTMIVRSVNTMLIAGVFGASNITTFMVGRRTYNVLTGETDIEPLQAPPNAVNTLAK